MEKDLVEAFMALDASQALEAVRRNLKGGMKPLDILDGCRRGITQIGERFARGETFLSELIIAAKLFQECMSLVEPHLTPGESGLPLGKVVLGTVKGDIHDIGKNIVTVLLRCEGFEVLDLGVDVPPERFVEAVATSGAPIVGMSCLLTTGFQSMKTAVQVLKDAGLRQQVFVVLGGGPVDGRVRDFVEADYAAGDAVDGIRACRHYLNTRLSDGTPMLDDTVGKQGIARKGR